MIHSYCVKPVRAGLFIAMCSTCHTVALEVCFCSTDLLHCLS